MFRKSFALLMITALLIPLCQLTASASSPFPDLDESHWAFRDILQLVDEGTINGFDDGTFKPAETVTRAQFVKMIGKGDTRQESDFADVSGEHWGYDYIMSSGFAPDSDNKFHPDTPITRGDVMWLLWSRAGEPSAVAPSIVTGFGPGAAAAAWGYASGIMEGNDGVNLRLDETMTRAEGAALIIRARGTGADYTPNDFVTKASPELLKAVFESFRLLDDIPYMPDKTITNGELARLALRFGLEEFNLSYKGYNTSKPFDHKYATDLYVLGKACLGEENINAVYIDETASVKDMLTALTYNAIRRNYGGTIYGAQGNFYSDVSAVLSPTMDVCLTWAYTNGIRFFANDKINADKQATLRDVAVVLAQLDFLLGSQSAYIIDSGQKHYPREDISILKDLYKFPSTYESFACVLEGLPRSLYETPFAADPGGGALAPAKDSFNFAREFGQTLIIMLDKLANDAAAKNNIRIKMTYYPSLVCTNGNGYSLKVKISVLESGGNITLGDAFQVSREELAGLKLDKGVSFYADIITGQRLSGVSMSHELAQITNVYLD